jgi:tetratricopeptide (TPR) repeat protein
VKNIPFHKSFSGRCVLIVLAALLSGCAAKQNGGTVRSDTAFPPMPKGTVKALSADDEARFSYFYFEAQKRKWKGEYDAAFNLLQHCLDINPHAPEALFDLSQFYVGLRDTAKAENALIEAVRIAPDNYWYLQRLADFYITKDDPKRSIDVYEHIYNRFPAHASEALSALNDLYSNTHQYDKAIDVLNRLEQRDGKSELLSREKIMIYQSLNQKKKAYSEMESLAREYPTDIHYQIGIGNLYLEDKKPEEAFKVYEEVKKKYPNDPVLLLSLVNYYRQIGADSLCHVQMDSLLANPKAETEVKVAIMQQYILESEQKEADSIAVLRRFDRALAEPQEDAALAKLCVQYLQLKRFPTDTIIPYYRKVLELEPEDNNARVQLLQYAQRQRNFTDMARLCHEGTLYNPEMVAYYYYEGTSYFTMNKYDEALAAFRRGMKAAGTSSDQDILSDLYAASGDLLREMGRKKESYAMYDSCLQYKYDNVMCLNNYAYYLSLDKVSLDKAEQMSFRTVKAEPHNKTYLDTYAWILFVQKRYTEAKIYIDQVVPPDSLAGIGRDSTVTGSVVEHAGDIYAKLGLRAKAMTYWLKAQQMGGGTDALPKKIRQKKYVE